MTAYVAFDISPIVNINKHYHRPRVSPAGVSLCAMCAALVLSGLVTTATFTLMMHCSRAAPPGMRATHYTALSTAEVLGKLSFMSLAGWLTDAVGYGPVYVGFVALALAAVPCAQRRYGIEERTRRQASNSKST